MPSYDYECRNCGHRVEKLHGVNDTGPTACDVCGGPMRKLLSTPNIVFKGSGWAKKDARDARPAAKPAPSTGKSESGGPAATGSGDSPSGGESGSGGDSGANRDSTTKTTDSAGGAEASKDISAGGASSG